MIDPFAFYQSSTTIGIEDNYVRNTYPDQTSTYNADTIRAGNDTVAINTAYIKPKIPDEVLQYAQNMLVKETKLNIYCNSTTTAGASYSIHQISGGDWDSRTKGRAVGFTSG